jgi:hypothetical protein
LAQPNVNPENDNSAALPLEELTLTPQWVKLPAKSFAQHTGDDRGPRRPGRPIDRAQRPRSQPKPRPPASEDRRPQGRERPLRREPPAELPVDVAFHPEETGFAAMVEAMKQSRRAYALFDIAKLVLNKPERHVVKVARKPGGDGSREPLVLVLEDGQICLTQEEAVRHIFRHLANKVFKEARRDVEPPRGNFSFVNRCGITGEWLGPPNYHEYANRLTRHHQQRLPHMPFEQFKARIQTIRDPEAVKAWIESASVVVEYHCALCPEPAVFTARREAEKHFEENHLAQFISTAAEVQIPGPASRQLPPGRVQDAIRRAWEAERRFPLNTANILRPRLRHAGLHAFKHKGVNYVSRVRPQRFESTQGLTEHVQKIITFLRAHDGVTVKKLLAQLLPAPDPANSQTATTDEQLMLADLHWLIRDGFVVEFSNGRLWAPADQPPPPPRVAAATPASATPPASAEAVTAAEPSEPVAEQNPAPTTT